MRHAIGDLSGSFLVLTSDLLLGFLVAVHDHAVDQATWFAVWVGFVFLCLLGFLVEVLCGLLVGFVVFIKVGYMVVPR